MGLLSSLLCTLLTAWSLLGLNTAIGSPLPAGAANEVPPNASFACTAEEPLGLPENAKVLYFAEGAPDEAFLFLLLKLSCARLVIEVDVDFSVYLLAIMMIIVFGATFSFQKIINNTFAHAHPLTSKSHFFHI